tara:strand:+ start:8835 stop:10391 length:1557 start_codon:yes stop_codon:yes gene_type:complete
MAGKNIQNIAIVSGSTLGSRVLGLFRDVLLFAFLGAGAINSAFIFAFTLPNLFRRLLGEGALTSALIPVFSETLESKGKEEAFRFLNQVLSWAFALLVVLIACGIWALAGLSEVSSLEERWYLGAFLGMVLMPYMLFICLAAVVSAVLNVLGRFAVTALSPMWLNLSMIASLAGVAWVYAQTPVQTVYCLCAGVLVGGFLQLITPVWALWREGWVLRLDFRVTQSLKEVGRLFVPGVLGAAVYQINIVVSRMLAFGLNASAVSVLYLANRLIELPMGVFAIAVATVVFPNLSLLVARGDTEGIGKAYGQGMRLIFAITVPAALGLIILCKPILVLLFEWGKFGAGDVALSAPVLMIYALGLPFYSLGMFATRGFHALKDTKTPVKVACLSFVVNVVLSLLLMRMWGTAGLATANILSAAVHGFVLHRLLVKKASAFSLMGFVRPLSHIAVATAAMSFSVMGILHLCAGGVTKQMALLAVAIGIPLAIIVYATFLWMLDFEDAEEVSGLIRKITGKAVA